MKQPTEYAAEFTNRLTAVWGFANNCILKRAGRGGRQKDNNPKTQRLGRYQGRDQKYYYKIITSELSHPGAKKCLMQISYTYEV